MIDTESEQAAGQTQDNPLHEWARLSKQNAEIEVAQAMLQGVFSTVSPVEKFGTWLLAGTAAASALMVANIDGLLTVFGVGELRTVVLLLLLATLIGLVGKSVSLFVQTQVAVTEKVAKQVRIVLEEYGKTEGDIEKAARLSGEQVATELDLGSVFQLVKPAVPKIMRRKVENEMRRGSADRLLGFKRIAKLCTWQQLLALLQFSTAFLALLVAGVCFDVPLTAQ